MIFKQIKKCYDDSNDRTVIMIVKRILELYPKVALVQPQIKGIQIKRYQSLNCDYVNYWDFYGQCVFFDDKDKARFENSERYSIRYCIVGNKVPSNNPLSEICQLMDLLCEIKSEPIFDAITDEGIIFYSTLSGTPDNPFGSNEAKNEFYLKMVVSWGFPVSMKTQ